MPSTCPKCHEVVEDDEICCAQVRYTWKCASCHKLSQGFALPYGKCHLCGGDLALTGERDLRDSLRFRAVRDAIQFELNAFQFYKMARDRATDANARATLERMFEMELDHLHEVEERYHAHLDRSVIEFEPVAEKMLADTLFRDSGVRGVYEAALALERHTRDHFRQLAMELPDGLEKDLCLELAAEEEEHIALLEGELEQL
jgi:rubrerythrin